MLNRRFVVAAALAAVMAIAIAATSHVIFVVSGLTYSAAATSHNDDNGNSMSDKNTMNLQHKATRTFYLFNTEIPTINETKIGFPGDVYSLPTMVVHKGDRVVVHFYNLETDKNEKHSFTLHAFHIDTQLAGGTNATDTFVANRSGIFEYHCIFHPPEMRGQLIVLR